MALIKGRIKSINVSATKGTVKKPVESAELVVDLGIKDDAHAAPGIRQVSLLAFESIKKQKECIKVKKVDFMLEPGDFAENITTEGLNLLEFPIGTKFKIGNDALVEVSKIGKECHQFCEIYHRTGDCIMPREGIFVSVLDGGVIKTGDEIAVIC